jgi:hypothetical protein
MASESGDTKLLGNFGQLIELVSLDPNYNPANPALPVAALNTRKTAGTAAVTSLGQAEAAFKALVNDRQYLFETVPGVMTRSGNMLKASGAGQKIMDDAKGVQRKITGQRKTAKVKDDPKTPQNEAAKTHSVSQQSYESIVGNVEDYIAIVETVTGYKPNEPSLTVAGLKSLLSDLKAKNDAVNSAFAALSVARGQRDQLLYTNDDSIVNIALLVKAYVRAALGPDSQLYKSIKGIPFKRRGN